MQSRPRGYKTFFMLNSTENEISTAHKNLKILTNVEDSCYKSLRCCIYHADKCYIYEQDKFCDQLSMENVL